MAAAGLPANAVMVEIGLHNEDQVEIVRGLSEGQEVLLPEIRRPLNNTTTTRQGAGMGVPIPGAGGIRR